RLDEFYKLVPASAIGVIVATAVTAVLARDLEYPRFLLVYLWLFALLFVAVGRLAHGALRSLAYARGLGELRVLIVGAGEAGNLILERIRSSPRLGYHAVAFLDDDRVGQKVLGLPVVAGTDELGDVVRTLRIDEVIIALPDAPHQEILSIVSKCEDGSVSIKVFPDVFQIMASEVNIGDLSGCRCWRCATWRCVVGGSPSNASWT